MQKDLIVAIFASTNAENPTTGVFGTGYPVAEDLILTSRHVVAPGNPNTPARIEVKWFYDQPADKKSPAWTKADLVWTGAGDLDAALIRCPRPAHLRKFPLDRLIERKPTDGESWESTGFALANKHGKVRRPGEFGGTVRSMADAAPFFEVVEGAPPTRAPQEPIAEEQWGGASGMPIFVASGILGILCQIPPKHGNKKLEVVPAWLLLRDEKFREALGIDEQCKRLDSARKLLCRLLERSDAATGDFAAGLGLPCGDIPSCREQLIERLLVEKLPLERLFELALSVRDKRRGRKDTVGAQVAQDLMLTILPAIHDVAVVADVRRDKSSVCPLALPTKLRTFAEIIMAGADRRAARLRSPATRLVFPEGEACLPEPPECGRDADGKQFARDWRAHLLEIFDTDLDRFKNAFQDYLKERFIQSELRSAGAGISEEELVQAVAGQLQREAEAKDGGLTYYFIARIPENDEARKKQEQVLADLKKIYRHVAFLRLAGTDPLDVEMGRYSPLRDLIYEPLDPKL
jgi:hypothetical protein